MNISAAVVKRLLNLCDERNITINRLCTMSAVTQSTVNDIVNGRSKNIGIITIKKLCDGLNITVYDFFNDEIFIDSEQEIC